MLTLRNGIVRTLLLLGAALLPLLPTPAAAQCELRVSGGESAPGVAGGVNVMVPWDRDGNGPEPLKVYAAGFFGSIGDLQVNNIAAWNGTAWEPLGAGVNGPIFAMTVYNNKLYVAGRFTAAGTTSALNIARWTGTAWESLPLSMTFPPDYYQQVTSLAVYNGDLYFGGAFLTVNNLVNAVGVAKYNSVTGFSALGELGQTDAPMGYCWSLATVGNGVVVGGRFDRVAGQPTQNIARWSGAAWRTFPGTTGVEDTVYRMAVQINEVAIVTGFGNVTRLVNDVVTPFPVQPSYDDFYDSADAAFYHNGQLYFAGSFQPVQNGPRWYMIRWTGSSWVQAGPAFNDPPGSFGTPLSHAGEVWIPGSSSLVGGVPVAGLSIWNGSTVRAVAPPSGFNDSIYGSAVAGGDMYVLGGFSHHGTQALNRVARWDGSRWHPLGAGFDGNWGAAGLTTFNGSVIAFGYDELSSGGVTLHGLARWTGSSWQPLASSVMRGTSPASITCAVEWNGRLIVGGSFDRIDGVLCSQIAAWDGTTFSPLGSGLNFFGPDELAVYNGDLIAAGDFTQAGGVPVLNAARFDGSRWHAMGSGIHDAPQSWANTAEDMLVYNGELYVCGNFGVAGGVPTRNIAKWNGSAWSAVGAGFGGDDDIAWDMAVHAGQLYIAGYAQDTSLNTRGTVRKWDGSTMEDPIGTTVGTAVYAIDSYAGRLFIGGLFGDVEGSVAAYATFLDCVGVTNPAPGVANAGQVVTDFQQYAGTMHASTGGTAPGVFRWNGTAFSTLSNPTVNGAANALAAWAPLGGPERLYASGTFTQAGGATVNNVAQWTGTAWAAMGTGLSPNGALAALPFEGNLWLGGAFTTAGGQAAAHVARWTGFSWQAIQGLNGAVNDFAVHNGQIYAAGAFTQINGANSAFVARWNGSAWQPVGTGLTAGAPGGTNQAYALASYNGQLYAGGLFAGAGGAASPNLVRWDGNAWQGVGGGASGPVYALAAQGGRLAVGGDFATVGAGVSARDLAWWSGLSWESFGGGTDGAVRALEASGCSLYIGGSFNAVNGVVSPNAAVWSGDPIPQISQFPVSVTAACPGQTVVFSLAHESTCFGLTYRWRRGASPINNGPTGWGSTVSGADTPTLTVQNAQFLDEGVYTCVITTSAGGGTFTTPPAQLTLSCPITNDDCSGAIALTGNGQYTAFSYAAQGDNGDSPCDTVANNRDVWFRLTAPAGGTAIIDACGSDYDTMISVHSACPGTVGNTLACATGGAACGAPRVVFAVAPGQSYYIRVGGRTGGTGLVRLNVNAPVPESNDACAAPAHIQEGAVLVGTLYGATNDGESTCGADGASRDAWYVFYAPRDGTLTLDTCATNDWNGFVDSGMDTTLSLREACGRGAAGQLACNDDDASMPCDTGAVRRDSRVSLAMASGQRVLARVAHHGDSFGNGMFLLHADFDGPGCDSLDFNNDGLYPDNFDLVDFLAVFGGGECPTGVCNDIDFNNDGLYPDNTDIISLFSVFGGGGC
ncbi:MAG TPA: hypothetical protein VD971_05545 [Phycisphaerales bacterium]|nr:hypothetical protein [Phycisphaerales bacterium]